jgi:hypothetical protein
MLFYRLGNNNQTDQGDETEVWRRRDYKDEGIVSPAVVLLNYMTG